MTTTRATKKTAAGKTKKRVAKKRVAKKRVAKKKPPWERGNPRPGKKTLSKKGKARARARAKRAGRTYPNLVDNMREASKKKPTKRRAR